MIRLKEQNEKRFPRFFKMKITSSKSKKNESGFGGARAGAGRKAGGQNADMADRKLISKWFCDWFSRELKKTKRLGVTVTDADCEIAINETVSTDEPVFPTEKTRPGGMWQKARTGARPFSADRLSTVALAAEKLGFWDQAWRREGGAFGRRDNESKLDTFILAMLSVDGFADQKTEKQKFKALHINLTKRLKSLSECKNAAKFEKVKDKTQDAIAAWLNFADELPQTVGYIGLRPDLEASFQEPGTDRYYRLKPAQALKWLSLLQFGRGQNRMQQLRWQVWALHFFESLLFDISTAKEHAPNMITGTKLSQ